MNRTVDQAVDRGAVFTRLLHRNAVRRSLGLRPLDVRRLYFQKVAILAKPTRKGTCMTNNPIFAQADLEPTESERQKIMDDLVARNAERAAQGLPARDVAMMFELGLARHRAQKYQALLGPNLEVCLHEIQPPGGNGLSPADYRKAVAKAEKQLLDATGIASPKSTMVSGVADMARHRP
jgi:hypothetical protein